VIPPEFIDDVLARTDVVEIIEPRVTLKKSGQNYTGLCPFHNEKSPSFSVSQDKQFYYCFGCQASGSALKFLMEFDRMDFVAAVEYLAQRAGMEVPKEGNSDPERSQKLKTLYEVLEQSAGFYQSQLRQHESKSRAVDYLKGRGVSGEVARDYGIGFAPPGWDNLLRKQGVTNADRQLLIDAGMVTENAEESKTYDRFRDRIMFPIRDLRGRTIAFGGRVLDDSKPKYLNSPETPVFHKSRELYGLYEARKKIRRLQKFVVVEGYMDVVALAQHGIAYSVATLGTATSTEHIRRMFKMVPQVVFCFDGDNAGRNAAWKALQMTLPAMEDGCSAKFLFVPDGDDPDSLIRREGQEKFEKRMSKAPGLADFFFQKLEEELDMGSIEGKAALSKLAVPLLSEVPEGVFRQLMIDELSARSGLEAERLIGASGLKEPKARLEPILNQQLIAQRTLKQSKLSEYALRILVRHPHTANLPNDDDLAKLEGVANWQLMLEILRWARGRETSPVLLLSHFQDSAYFEYLRELAEQDPMLTQGQLSDEFLDTLRKMIADAEQLEKQKVMDDLARKRPSELNETEKKFLAEFYRNRS
jgi:DNA primase